LRGRCARQGDPGSSQFYISFEDDLMRNFGDSRRISTMMTRLGMEENEGLSHPWLNKTVENAQKRVEERNYLMRKHTLQYDDVMNQQRTVIYTYRNDILTTDNTRPEIFEVVDEVILREIRVRLEGGLADVDGLLKWLNNAMPLGLSRDDVDWNQSSETISEIVKQRIRAAYETKIRYEIPEAITYLERSIVLNAIDRLWQEHLYAMDGLRASIGLRAHGQKDPLIEYKQEGYEMFEELMGNIKTEIVHNLFRSSSSLSAFEQFLQALPQRFIHEQLPSLTAQPDPAETALTAANESAVEEAIHLPIHRAGPKLGRNDPCPLDPKKKFKNCCGASGQKFCSRSS